MSKTNNRECAECSGLRRRFSKVCRFCISEASQNTFRFKGKSVNPFFRIKCIIKEIKCFTL